MADASTPYASSPVSVIPGRDAAFTQKFNASPITVEPTFNAAEAFVKYNRIHLQHGSYFDAHNPLILIHPRELRPENNERLRFKVRRALEEDVPPYFADQNIGVFAEQFIKMMPLSVEAKQEAISKSLMDLMKHQQTGEDPDVAKERKNATSPFAAEVELKLKKNELGAVEKEMLKNGLGLYLIINHGLQSQFQKGLAEFFPDISSKQPGNPEQLFAHIQPFTGINPHELIEASRKDGLSGVAKKLGVDESYVQEVKLLLEVMPNHMFSLSALEAWEAGRKRPGMQAMGPEEKIRVGMVDLVSNKIHQAKKALGGSTDIHESMKPMEQMFAGHLSLLPPELAETLLRLGTDIAYTPDPNLKFTTGVQAYGFYRHVNKNPGDLTGIYHIFLSGNGGPESFAETMVHEAHHLVMPTRLTESEVQKVDSLASAEGKRLSELNGLLSQWMGGNAATKAAVEKDIDARFMTNGKTLSQVMGNADMYRVYQMVNETFNQLQIDSNFYYKSGYDSPVSRFSEVFSRYAQMRFVRWREQPELMKFVVPNITQAYEEVYMPHVRGQLSDMRAFEQSFALKAPAATVNIAAAKGNSAAEADTAQPSTTGRVPLLSDWMKHADTTPLTRIIAQSAKLVDSSLLKLPNISTGI